MRKAMRTVKSKLHEDPNNAWFHSALGVAYAGLGRRDDAVREGRLAVPAAVRFKGLRETSLSAKRSRLHIHDGRRI